MNRPTARPRARRAAILGRWAATLGCLMLLMVVSPADELYDFVATDLRGTPSLVNFRTGRRNVTRSRRKASRRREQLQTRKVALRSERINYVRTRKRLRLPDAGSSTNSSRTRLATNRTPANRASSNRTSSNRVATNRTSSNRVATNRSTSRTRVASSTGTRSNSRRRTTSTRQAPTRQAQPRSNGSRRTVLARAPRLPRPATNGIGSRQNQNTLPRPAPDTSPGTSVDTSPESVPARSDAPVLARVPEEEIEQPQEEQDEEGEVRQNLLLAFVTPRNTPAVGVRLVARVVPAEGKEETLANLTTDSSGRLKLLNIALPAAIDLDFPDSKPASSKADEAPEAPLEWDFADADKSTLLLEKPVGQGRLALASDNVRLASLHTANSGAVRLAATSRRVHLFEGELSPIVLERQVVDLAIAAPPGSKLSSPALEDGPEEAQLDPSASKALTVPAVGRLGLRLPIEALEEGPIPIRVARELAGGEAEAVIESYTTDAYAVNTVQAPPLRLVRLSELDMAGRVGVMGLRANVARRLGDLKGNANKQNALGIVTPLADGSEWWSYPDTGIAFKMRLAPEARPEDKGAAMRVERVRLFTANAGSFGTVKVGSTVEQMREALGAPQSQNAKRTPADNLSAPGQIDTWLDGGLRVCHDGAQVLWLESARPNGLLTGGTTAFVQRSKARLFVESFQSNPRINLSSTEDLRKYLEQEHSVATVGSPDEADLILKARVAEFKEGIGSTTRSYNAVTKLQYSLFDTNLGHFIAQNKQAEGKATVDLAESAPGASAQGPESGQAEQNRATQQAAGAASAISVGDAFNALVGEVNRAADFSVRVTDIDYEAGTLRLNAGRAQGLRVSRSDPDDFQITVAGTPLPEVQQGRSSQFYVARVVAVGRDWAVCRLLRANFSVKNLRAGILEGVTEEPAPDMVRRLPDPATGQVAARSWTPLPLDANASTNTKPPVQPRPERNAPRLGPQAALPWRREQSAAELALLA